MYGFQRLTQKLNLLGCNVLDRLIKNLSMKKHKKNMNILIRSRNPIFFKNFINVILNKLNFHQFYFLQGQKN